MTTISRRTGITGAALLALALPAVAPAQFNPKGQQSELTRHMGIDQKLGVAVPKDAVFQDETGAKRTFGSVLQGRPVLVLPLRLRCDGGCLLMRDSLQKVLYRAEHPNERKLVKKEGPNLLEVGKDLDVVFLSLDPREKPADGAALKADFEKKIGYTAEPVTVLTGSLDQIQKVTKAIGFRYLFDPQRDILNNATGSVLISPDGHVSAYTVGNGFQTIVLERSLELAKANQVGALADESDKFGCIQLGRAILARRAKIEAVYTGAAVVTMLAVASWIGLMLRSERNRNHDLGGQPGGA
jgi:protein SCO1/2